MEETGACDKSGPGEEVWRCGGSRGHKWAEHLVRTIMIGVRVSSQHGFDNDLADWEA